MMSNAVDVPKNVEVLNVEMKRFVLDPSSSVYSQRLNELIESQRIRLPQLEVLTGGLHAVEEGLRRMKAGRMEGKKLIVSFDHSTR